ncbi:MAG: chemotaxis response regulator protein-glutamate methylesterase [Chitinivibrionales bacterium]|nr:chemotaxis response regulator protein-glutamate methylesterase [Chitinivibrionales bacterium]
MTISVLIIDDSVLYRKICSEVVAGFSEVSSTITAPNADIALKKIEQYKPDLVFCDVYMPQKDGVETLIEIRQRFPTVIVVMMSSISTRSADITIKALQLGALDFIRKPNFKSISENISQLKSDVQSVLRLVQIRRNTLIVHSQSTVTVPKSPKPAAPSRPISNIVVPKLFSIVVIGVSTGGPEALNKLIPALPATLPVPVLIVQHMPPQFTKSLADSLDKKSAIRVVESTDEQPISAGYIYLAPGGRHMTVRQLQQSVVIGLNDGPAENSCRPSVDVLFRSVANVFSDKGILAVILTGMGNDGVNGLRTLKRRGCYCITQSEQSCVVYGMPRAVDEAGMADISLPIEEIAHEICKKLNCY